jgi:hypothetical protein
VGPTATLVVTVSDRFGSPVPITHFDHRSTSGTVTVEVVPDSAGRAVIDVPAGAGTLHVSHVRGRARTDVDLAQDSRTDLALTLEAWQFAAMSVLDAAVVPGSVSDDGRSVELSVEVSVPTEFYRYQRPSGDGPMTLNDVTIEVPACAARSDRTGLGTLGPLCVDAGTGTDRSWRVASTVSVGPRMIGSRPAAGPVVLMLDRSEHVEVIMDYFGEQRFAAKSLVDALLPGREVGIAAFASDGGPTGTASRLPQKPVTFYPVENPGWATSRVEAFEALESLRGVTGGASPLREAITAGVDYLGQRTAADERPALVVLSAGFDDLCPAPDGCGAAWRDLSERALQAGVSVWLIAPGELWYIDWYYAPGFPPAVPYLAREPGIRWVVAPHAMGLHSAIEVARAALQGEPVVHEVRFRIESDSAGAFTPGSRVLGQIVLIDFAGDPGWGMVQALPFTALVPVS